MAENNKATIWGAIITGLTAVSVALIPLKPWEWFDKKTTFFAGTVTNSKGQVIDDARITIYPLNVSYSTHSKGRFEFQFKENINELSVSVEKEGYEPFSRVYTLPSPENTIQLTEIQKIPIPVTSTKVDPKFKPKTDLTPNYINEKNIKTMMAAPKR